jgi:hypothetical protein
MPFIPDLFVTPHAIEQFQQRIAPMAAARARDCILEGISRSNNVNVLPDGTTLRIRTERPFPFQFRAFVVFDEAHERPVVTTVVRGDRNITRKHKRKAARDAAREREHNLLPPQSGGSSKENDQPAEQVENLLHNGSREEPDET